MAAVAKDSVEGICSKIYQLSAEYSRRLRQTHLSLLQDLPTGEGVWARFQGNQGNQERLDAVD